MTNDEYEVQQYSSLTCNKVEAGNKKKSQNCKTATLALILVNFYALLIFTIQVCLYHFLGDVPIFPFLRHLAA